MITPVPSEHKRCVRAEGRRLVASRRRQRGGRGSRRRRRSCSRRSEKDFQSSDRRWVYAEPEGQKKKVVLLSGQQPSGILTPSSSGKGLQLERAAAHRDDVTSDGTKKGGGATDGWRGEAQTQVPWCAGGRALRFFKACDLSLKSVGFCWEMSISTLATMIPGKTGGKNLFQQVT